MTTAKTRNLFEEIREGLEAYRDRRLMLRRRVLPAPDVKAIRKRLGLSQADIATIAKKAGCRLTLG